MFSIQNPIRSKLRMVLGRVGHPNDSEFYAHSIDDLFEYQNFIGTLTSRRMKHRTGVAC